MNQKIIAIALCLAVAGHRSMGQELGIELDGGLQGTRYPLQNGTVMPMPGGAVGLTYSFRLGGQWGLVTGISGGIYRTQATLGDSVFSYGEVDDAGSAFEYRVKTTGYKETQQFIAASIPLLLQYHTPGTGTRWYFDVGARALFPLTASVHQSAQQVSLSGYYPNYNIEVTDLPQHGFGTIPNWSASQTVALKPGAVLSASTGFSFLLARGTRLYAGVYFDYGLTDLKSARDSLPLMSYSAAGINQVQGNSVLKMPIAGQMSLLSAGLQVRFSFGPVREKPAVAKAHRREKKEVVGGAAASNGGAAGVPPVSKGVPAGVPANAVPPVSKVETPAEPLRDSISDNEADVVQAPVIFGALGETSISDFQQTHLNDLARILLRYPRLRISIVGHFCNSGTTTESVKVAATRAKAVARYLERKGVDRNRMDVSYLNQSDPVLPNNPAANYRNRRVVVTLTNSNHTP